MDDTMAKQRNTEIYEKYHGMVFNIAYNFSQKFSKPYDEMVSEAEYILAYDICGRWEHFDETKSRRSTWAYLSIYWGLMTYCTGKKRKEISLSSMCDEETDFEPQAPEERYRWLNALLTEISEEGAYLVKTIINTPKKLGEDAVEAWEYNMQPKSKARARNQVKTYLMQEKQWTKAKWNRAFKEVAACL